MEITIGKNIGRAHPKKGRYRGAGLTMSSPTKIHFSLEVEDGKNVLVVMTLEESAYLCSALQHFASRAAELGDVPAKARREYT